MEETDQVIRQHLDEALNAAIAASPAMTEEKHIVEHLQEMVEKLTGDMEVLQHRVADLEARP